MICFVLISNVFPFVSHVYVCRQIFMFVRRDGDTIGSFLLQLVQNDNEENQDLTFDFRLDFVDNKNNVWFNGECNGSTTLQCFHDHVFRLEWNTNETVNQGRSMFANNLENVNLDSMQLAIDPSWTIKCYVREHVSIGECDVERVHLTFSRADKNGNERTEQSQFVRENVSRKSRNENDRRHRDRRRRIRFER